MLHPFTLFEGQAQAGRFGRIGFWETRLAATVQSMI